MHRVMAVQHFLPLPIAELQWTVFEYDLEYQTAQHKQRLFAKHGQAWFLNGWWARHLFNEHWFDILGPWIELELIYWMKQKQPKVRGRPTQRPMGLVGVKELRESMCTTVTFTIPTSQFTTWDFSTYHNTFLHFVVYSQWPIDDEIDIEVQVSLTFVKD